MSIRVNEQQCVGCQSCQNICPGDLIQMNDHRKATIADPSQCWGCTACMKECPYNAIALQSFVTKDGAWIETKNKEDVIEWSIRRLDKVIEVITTKKSMSNNY